MNRHFGGLSQPIAEWESASICCLNRHFGGLSQRCRSFQDNRRGCLDRHFGGLSQLMDEYIHPTKKLLGPPFRRPFTTPLRDCHGVAFVAWTAISAAFHNLSWWTLSSMECCLDRHFGGLSQHIENSQRAIDAVAWTAISAAFHNCSLYSDRSEAGCLDRHFGGLSQLYEIRVGGYWSCLDRHFGGLSQPTEDSFNVVNCCLDRHFGGLSQHEAGVRVHEVLVAWTAISAAFHNWSCPGMYCHHVLLGPPFRRPFTT